MLPCLSNYHTNNHPLFTFLCHFFFLFFLFFNQDVLIILWIRCGARMVPGKICYTPILPFDCYSTITNLMFWLAPFLIFNLIYYSLHFISFDYFTGVRLVPEYLCLSWFSNHWALLLALPLKVWFDSRSFYIWPDHINVWLDTLTGSFAKAPSDVACLLCFSQYHLILTLPPPPLPSFTTIHQGPIRPGASFLQMGYSFFLLIMLAAYTANLTRWSFIWLAPFSILTRAPFILTRAHLTCAHVYRECISPPIT